MREAGFILIMRGEVCPRHPPEAPESAEPPSGTVVAFPGIVETNELTVTLTDGSARTFSGGYRELSLLRARLLMAVEGKEIGIISHALSSGRVTVRADQVLEVGCVRTV